MPKTFTYEQKALAAEIVRAYQSCAGNVSQAAVQCGRNRSTVQSYLKYWRDGAFDGVDSIPAHAEPVSSLKHISTNDGELSQAAPDQTQAVIAPLPQYLDAHLTIRSDIERESFDACVLHELRHCSLSWIEDAIRHAWDGRRKLDRDEALRLVAGVIETVIQRDVDIFMK